MESLTGFSHYWMAGNYLKYGASEAKFGSKNASVLIMEAKMDLEYIEDLIEDIKRIDALIQLHVSNNDPFMVEQWERKKLRVMKEIVDELTHQENLNLDSVGYFLILRNILNKYYPGNQAISNDSLAGRLLAVI